MNLIKGGCCSTLRYKRKRFLMNFYQKTVPFFCALVTCQDIRIIPIEGGCVPRQTSCDNKCNKLASQVQEFALEYDLAFSICKRNERPRRLIVCECTIKKIRTVSV
jgi:hypothetical protein